MKFTCILFFLALSLPALSSADFSDVDPSEAGGVASKAKVVKILEDAGYTGALAAGRMAMVRRARKQLEAILEKPVTHAQAARLIVTFTCFGSDQCIDDGGATVPRVDANWGVMDNE